jgi:monolysocardiolipin acyltransferase
MPEGRPFPNKFLPRLNQDLSVTFGDPIPADRLISALSEAEMSASAASMEGPIGGAAVHGSGWMGDLVTTKPIVRREEPEIGKHAHDPQAIIEAGKRERRERMVGRDVDTRLANVRSDVTEIIHDAVEELGRTVAGDRLGKPTGSETG